MHTKMSQAPPSTCTEKSKYQRQENTNLWHVGKIRHKEEAGEHLRTQHKQI